MTGNVYFTVLSILLWVKAFADRMNYTITIILSIYDTTIQTNSYKHFVHTRLTPIELSLLTFNALAANTLCYHHYNC